MSVLVFPSLFLDIEVKIITIPESQLKEKGSGQGILQTGEGDEVTGSVTSAVSKLFSKLLVSLIMNTVIHFFWCKNIFVRRKRTKIFYANIILQPKN